MLIFFYGKRAEWKSHGRANRESEKLTEFEVADRAKLGVRKNIFTHPNTERKKNN